MLSVLSEGLAFTAVERLIAKNSISICTEKKSLINFELLSMGCESILSFDCAWWHKRNSHQCFSAIFDIITEKIVGWNATENKLIPSQQFEGEILTSMKYI